MGFPNVDKKLVKIFLQGFADAQALGLAIPDAFEDLDPEEQSDIALYLSRRTVTDDIRERAADERFLYIVPHFPLAGYPFPQVGISVGQESPGEKFLGDYTGETVEVTDDGGDVIGWDTVKGYLAAATYNIDVVCNTKDEVIWLSRLCQYFICQSLGDLTEAGIMQVDITLTDPRIDPQAATQPADIFTRTVTVSAQVANTWKVRKNAYTYATGVNKALDTL
jgi:hypothetical protein